MDPDKELILVYNFENSISGQYNFQETVKAGIYEDLLINFKNLDI